MQPATPVQAAGGGTNVAQDIVIHATDESMSDIVGEPAAKKTKGAPGT